MCFFDSVSDRIAALESLGELAIEDDKPLWDANFHSVLMKTLQLLDNPVVCTSDPVNVPVSPAGERFNANTRDEPLTQTAFFHI